MLELIGAIIILIVFALWRPYVMSTGKNGAPFVPMEPDVVEKVMKIAKVGPGDIFYDLGSGDGRLVTTAALHGATAYGVEIDSLRVWYSRLWFKILRLKNAHILHKNIFDVDLSPATVVNLYLLQDTNDKIEGKLLKELKPGTRIVSVAFDFPDWKLADFDPEGTIYGPISLYIV